MTKNADVLRSYRIKYDVHCRIQNFFGKEIVVKNCYNEVHAKFKLGTHCEKKYGKEFDFIIFKSVTEEGFDGLFNDIFGNVDNNFKGFDNTFSDLMKNLKNKKK